MGNRKRGTQGQLLSDSEVVIAPLLSGNKEFCTLQLTLIQLQGTVALTCFSFNAVNTQGTTGENTVLVGLHAKTSTGYLDT